MSQREKAAMRVVRILRLYGPNIWSRRPVLEVWLEPETALGKHSCPMQACRHRLSQWWNISSISSRALRNSRNLFLRRLERVNDEAQLLQFLILELQCIAGTRVDRAWSETALIPLRVAVEFVEESVALLALELAQSLIAAAQMGVNPGMAGLFSRLRECARQACLGGTTGPIVAAAQARNIPVQRLDDNNLMQLGHGARQRLLRGSMTGRTGFLAEAISGDKLLTKQLLSQLGVPVPRGRLVTNADDAWAAACEFGLPVIVKPRDEDCSIGVSLMLRTRPQVAAAYLRARECRPDVLVEPHLPGIPHRLFIVSDRLVAAVRRDPAQVFGDGRQTIEELVAEANRDPRRGNEPDLPLSLIEIDDEVLQILGDQELGLASIPANGDQIALRYDPKTCYGGTITDVTEQVHPEVAAAALDAVRILGLDVAGVDVMATDIGRPLEQQGGGILEVNSGPAIYLHFSPLCEPGRPVAEAIVESLFAAPDTGRIPIVAVTGSPETPRIAARIAGIVAEGPLTVGLSMNAVTSVGGRLVAATWSSPRAAARALLRHPRVELAVLEVSLANIQLEGQPFDECRVAVVCGSGPSQRTRCADREACLRVMIDSVALHGMIVANANDLAAIPLFIAGDSRLVAASADRQAPFLVAHRMAGGIIAFVDGNHAVVAHQNQEILRRPLTATISVDSASSSNSFAGETLCELSIVGHLLAVAAAWAVAYESATVHQPPGVGRERERLLPQNNLLTTSGCPT